MASLSFLILVARMESPSTVRHIYANTPCAAVTASLLAVMTSTSREGKAAKYDIGYFFTDITIVIHRLTLPLFNAGGYRHHTRFA